ncbi:Protein SERAC1 [Beauveria bassiana]|uniref:Protein SERAC1 n=1 Tax=Beauveria bassiana TaxID=176275 RepID=A0A2N6N8S4_BEABA|nr:Protein SERAC1 [Beauveria bassiana]
MLRKLAFRSKIGTEMRPTNDNHQCRLTESAAFASEPFGTLPSVRRDSNASISSSPLGLHIVHQPDELFGDIVFVHGFGGSPYKTWAWDQDNQDSFWPAWLPDCDLALATFRISTFSYNAKLKGSATSLGIVDIAQGLLFELSAAFDGQSQSRSRPIIFIAHSLGGLVVKKAYTLGKHDEQYKGVTQRICGMIFLSTPHRGSHYAKMMKNILSTAPTGTCSNHYIAALALQSTTMQEINESFRIHCKDIKLCSFFETLKTHLTVRNIWRQFCQDEKHTAYLDSAALERVWSAHCVEFGAVDEPLQDKDDDDGGFPVTNEEQDGAIMPDDRELPPVMF